MKFWAIDSPVMRVLGRLGDIIILNMIFVVGCIPVITIGTSLSALYAVAMKMARGEDPSVWKEFWKAYKRNFNHLLAGHGCHCHTAVCGFPDHRSSEKRQRKYVQYYAYCTCSDPWNVDADVPVSVSIYCKI